MAEHFSDEGKLNQLDLSTYNKAKFNDENNFKKFINKVESDLPLLTAMDKADDIIKESYSQLKNKTISVEVNKKIMDKLLPALSQLDAEYLEKNKGAITSEIAKSLNANKTFGSIFRKNFDIASKDLDKISDQIIKNHLNKSTDFEFEKIAVGLGLRGGASSQE